MTHKEEILSWIKKSTPANTSTKIILAQKRFLADMKSKKYFVDWDLFDRLNDFFELFKHYTGAHDGVVFTLSTWQKFLLVNIFCVKNKKTGERKYRQVYCQIARKNGKSALISIIALWGLLMDGEANSQVVIAANTKSQADIVFKMANTYLRQVTKKGKTYRTSKIQVENNELFIVSSDASRQDGLNPSIGIIDEYHEAKNNDMHQVLKSGQGTRKQPLLIVITTAGFNKNSACYAMRNYSIEVLNNDKKDDIFFPLIFELNDGDSPYYEGNWIKSNPNLDITVNRDFLTDQLLQAKQDLSQTSSILTKNLNLWQDKKNIWIPGEYITGSFITESDWFDKLSERPNIVYIGTDLADVSDLNANALMFCADETFYFNIKYYLPEQFANYQQNMSLYKGLAENGMLTFTGGSVVDFNVMLNDIINVRRLGRIGYLFYDPYNAKTFIDKCKSQKINCEPFSQSIASFNTPTKELQMSILSGKVRFVENDLTLKCFNDVTILSDHNSNEKPGKEDHHNQKIDGVIASVQSLAAWLLDPKRRK